MTLSVTDIYQSLFGFQHYGEEIPDVPRICECCPHPCYEWQEVDQCLVWSWLRELHEVCNKIDGEYMYRDYMESEGREYSAETFAEKISVLSARQIELERLIHSEVKDWG